MQTDGLTPNISTAAAAAAVGGFMLHQVSHGNRSSDDFRFHARVAGSVEVAAERQVAHGVMHNLVLSRQRLRTSEEQLHARSIRDLILLYLLQCRLESRGGNRRFGGARAWKGDGGREEETAGW